MEITPEHKGGLKKKDQNIIFAEICRAEINYKDKWMDGIAFPRGRSRSMCAPCMQHCPGTVNLPALLCMAETANPAIDSQDLLRHLLLVFSLLLANTARRRSHRSSAVIYLSCRERAKASAASGLAPRVWVSGAGDSVRAAP